MPFFERASNFTINGGNFQSQTNINNHYHGTSGLQILLESSIPDAAHDSSARQPPPSCHPNTREQYIKDITSWVRAHNIILPIGPDVESGRDHGNGNALHKLMWLSGAAGVGKSAVAQTCAEALEESSELGAAFFISQPNRRDDPDKFFTSIAYQLATRLQPVTSLYGALLDEEIRKDPSVVTKTLAVQFHKLIVYPILGLLEGGDGAHHQRVVVIVDGLDECAGHGSQCEILRIISEATLEYPSLPLIWAVFSRAEPHIESTIGNFGSAWWNVSLPISQDTHKDIEVYLKDNFARIQQQYNLSPGPGITWPSKQQVKALVYRSAGLFIYAATVIRLFDNPWLPEREKQLEELLSSRYSSPKPGTKSQLTSLHDFYMLIMRRIPQPSLSHTRTVLFVLANELFTGALSITKISNLLGYSMLTTLSIVNSLRSVLFLENDSVNTGKQGSKEVKIASYHYSFIEFLRSPERSGEFYVFDDECRASWSRRCLQILSEFNTGGIAGITLSNRPSLDSEAKSELQKDLLIEASCSLLGSYARISNLRNYPDLIDTIHTLDFQRITLTAGMRVQHLVMCLKEEELVGLTNQFSLYARDQGRNLRLPKLIRERFPFWNTITRQYYNLSHKFNSMILAQTSTGSLYSSAFTPTSTPLRVLSAYELGVGDKKVYLYPERGSFGVSYHVCTDLDDLREPYTFTDT